MDQIINFLFNPNHEMGVEAIIGLIILTLLVNYVMYKYRNK